VPLALSDFGRIGTGLIDGSNYYSEPKRVDCWAQPYGVPDRQAKLGRQTTFDRNLGYLRR
jgi:hypothetical protein